MRSKNFFIISKNLEKMLSGSLMILDDSQPFMSRATTDQLTLSSLITGCNTTIVDTLKGVGIETTRWLVEMGVYPKHVIIAPDEGNVQQSITKKLLINGQAIRKLKRIIKIEKIKYLLCFLPTKNLERLSQILRLKLLNDEWQSNIVNNKIFLFKLTKNIGLPMVRSIICSTREEFLKKINKNFLIKIPLACAGYGNFEYKKKHEFLKINHYPAILQQFKRTKASFTDSYFINTDGVIERIGSYTQLIKNFAHQGSMVPDYLVQNKELTNKMIKISTKIAQHIYRKFKFCGVIGIDYILTKQNRLMPVDLNGRFCTTTFPLIFLDYLKLNNKCFYLISKNLNNFHNLDEVMLFLGKNKFDGKNGVFPYYPEYNYKTGTIITAKFLLVGDTIEELNKYKGYINENF